MDEESKKIDARFQKFHEDFARLKSNREKVPLEQLQTKYAKPYNALVAAIADYAEWFTREYIRAVSPPAPPGDPESEKNKEILQWMNRRARAILDDERKPGGLWERIHGALITDLDESKFQDTVYEMYKRLEDEIFDPYVQHYNRWVGEPGNRWIYNDVLQGFWLVKPDYQEGGYWIDSNRNYRYMGYPPKIGPDPEGGQKSDAE